jgi:hypothetical protein
VCGLKGTLGESDSEVIRTMVISFLGEKGYLNKREENEQKEER